MALFDLARMGVKLQVEGESDVKGTHLLIQNVAIWSPSFNMAALMNTVLKNSVTMGPNSGLCFADSYALPASFDCLACSFHLCNFCWFMERRSLTFRAALSMEGMKLAKLFTPAMWAC
jgi:hypothetical protein